MNSLNILVIGGTRLMGKHLVQHLLKDGHNVTIATRGLTKDEFGNKVNRIVFDRKDATSIRENLGNKSFDVVYDSLAYASNDTKVLLDNMHVNRYIMTSTTAVYNKHINTKEDEFNPNEGNVIWCDRGDLPYGETKGQAEKALVGVYKNIKNVRVRFPFVIGEDDYTERLKFYVEHIIKGQPMHVDNFDKQMGFINSDEAGKFMAFFASNNVEGAFNASNSGTMCIKDIANYVEKKTGKKAILSEDGDEAPYNGENEYSINTEKAEKLGFEFASLNSFMFDLLDKYIAEILN